MDARDCRKGIRINDARLVVGLVALRPRIRSDGGRLTMHCGIVSGISKEIAELGTVRKSHRATVKLTGRHFRSREPG